MMEWPAYKCYKVVRAIKITEIFRHENGSATVKGGVYMFETWGDWMMKHKPEVGGYLVQYSDEYFSYSPAEPFESGYTLIQVEEPATEIV